MSTEILQPYWDELMREKSKIYSAIYFKICLKNNGRASRQFIIGALKSASLIGNEKRSGLESLPYMETLMAKKLLTEVNVAGEYYTIQKEVCSGEEKIALATACENVLKGKPIQPLVNLRKVMNNLVIKDEELKQPDNSQIQTAINDIRQKLLIDEKTILQLISSLISGKDILLTGPVGSGKTELATLLPREVWKNKNDGGYYTQVSTATSEWTTQDVIGGIFPKIDNATIKYEIQKGCVTETVQKNFLEPDREKRTMREIDGQVYRGVWLVIDEFNRANIDRAFGSLFTALLPGFRVLDIPTTKSGETSEKQKIPEDYRIIGTLNTADKHFLNDLSFALKRRFSIINIDTPNLEDIDEEKRIVEKKVIAKYPTMVNYESTFNNLFEIFSFVRIFKKLGTAFPISAFELILTNYKITNLWDQSLDFALVQQILPQIEDLSIPELETIRAFCQGSIAQFYRKFDIQEKENSMSEFADILGKLVNHLNILYPQDPEKRLKIIDGAIADAIIQKPIVPNRRTWIEWFSKGKIQSRYKEEMRESQNIPNYTPRLQIELDLDLNPWNLQMEKVLAPSQFVKGDRDPGKEKWKSMDAWYDGVCDRKFGGCGNEIFRGDFIVIAPENDGKSGAWVHAKCPITGSTQYNKIKHAVGKTAPRVPIFVKEITNLLDEKYSTEQSFV